MKRDDEYIRDLMFRAEASDDWRILVPGLMLLSPTEEQSKEAYHVSLLSDAGLLTSINAKGTAFRLTNAGHDWLSAVRDDNIWGKTKAGLAAAGKAAGEVPLALMGAVAMGYLKQQLQNLGIPIE